MINSKGEVDRQVRPYCWRSVGGTIWNHKTSDDDSPLYDAATLNAAVLDARRERDMALLLLAEWCVSVETDASWDGWDDIYKDAMYRPGPLRELMDKAIAEVREQRKDQ